MNFQFGLGPFFANQIFDSIHKLEKFGINSTQSQPKLVYKFDNIFIVDHKFFLLVKTSFPWEKMKDIQGLTKKQPNPKGVELKKGSNQVKYDLKDNYQSPQVLKPKRDMKSNKGSNLVSRSLHPLQKFCPSQLNSPNGCTNIGKPQKTTLVGKGEWRRNSSTIKPPSELG